MTPLELVLSKVDNPRQQFGYSMARCPAHEDDKASLSIKEGDEGRVLLNCFAGCSVESIAEGLGVAVRDLFSEDSESKRREGAPLRAYDYVAADGRLLYQVCRNPGKQFRQRRPDGAGGFVWNLQGVEHVLYRLPEVLAAVTCKEIVVIVEGEKDADRLHSLGLVATTKCGGANSRWRDSYSEALHGARVAILPDNDEPGREVARRTAKALHGVAAEVAIVELPDLPEKGDVSDWLAAGGTVEKLRGSIDAALRAQSRPPGVEHHRRGARLVRASGIEIERPTWAWDLRIPVAGVTLVAGREGMGKTALLGHLTARLTRGQLAGDFFQSARDVVYIGDEDDRASVLVPRLIAAGADLDRVHFMDLPAGVPFSIGDDVHALDELLTGLGVALVVIDPLDSHLGSGFDSHRKAEVQSAIGTLAVLAQKHRCGIAGLAHLNKGEARDLLTRVVGSVGFTTSVRSVLGVGEHPEDERDRVAVLGKANLTDKSSVPALRFRVEGVEVDHRDGGTVNTAGVVIIGEESGIDPHSIVSGLGSEERTDRDQAADWLAELLSDGPMLLKDIERLAREENIARATLHRAKARAGVRSERDDSARGRPASWSLSSHELSSPSHTLPGETKSNPGGERPPGPIEGVSSQPAGMGDETESGPAIRGACTRCEGPGAYRSVYGDLCDECTEIVAHGRELKPPRGWDDELEEGVAS